MNKEGRHAARKWGRYRNYLLAVLMVILTFNQMERFAIGLLLQDIKADFSLSDTQLGLLSGIAFALFYAIMGVPIARWADRGNRVNIIAVTIALWSTALALCGMAATFLQLLLIRVGVAVGEAGCVPPAHSLIADHFSRAERPRAVSRYMLGAPLGVVTGYLLAGWLNEFFGWRMTLIMLGLPGVVLAVLAKLTLKEPRNQLLRIDAASPSAQPGIRTVCHLLWRNITFRHLLAGFALASFFGYGISQWKAAFFIRSYGLQTGELGTWFAAIYGICGTLGVYCGGEWATRYAAQNERLQLKAMAACYSGFAVVSALIYLSSSPYMAFPLLAVATFGFFTINGPLFAMIQTLVPERMRAVSIALVFLFANLIGMGLGPLAVGAMSDACRLWAGEESLRYALLALCPGYFWAGWHLWRARRTVVHDLQVAQCS